MDIALLHRLVQHLQTCQLGYLQLDSPGFQLRLVRPGGASAARLPPSPAAPAAPAAATPRYAATATGCGHFYARHPARENTQLQPGAAFDVGTPIGVLAVRELLLPVVALVAGRAGAYLVEDGQLVDFGTPLLALAD